MTHRQRLSVAALAAAIIGWPLLILAGAAPRSIEREPPMPAVIPCGTGGAP